MKHQFYGAVAKVAPYLLQTRKQRLSILTYHRVLPEYDPMRRLEPTAEVFNWQMELLSRYFNPLSLSDALSMMRDGQLPDRAVCITFDDGYANNAEQALPILRRWKMPATVFVTTGFLNGGRMWNDSVIEAVRIAEGAVLDLRDLELEAYDIDGVDKRRSVAGNIIGHIKHWQPEKRALAISQIESQVGPLPDNLMMTDSQVRELSESGVEIGAHTKSHPILATLEPGQVREEIGGSKAYLESLLDKQVRYFAYPNGQPDTDYRVEDRDLVEALGFEAALSTCWGVASQKSDLWQLPRFTPWDKTPFRFMTRLLLNYRNPA